MKLISKERTGGNPAIEIEMDKVDKLRVLDIIHSLVDVQGKIYPIPLSFIKDDNEDTLNVVMQALGLYTFPTLELTEWLEEQIDEYTEGYEPAIEICAGSGWIGRQLQIPTTDAKIQEDPRVRNLYLMSNQIPIIYQDDVEKIEALEAVKKYNPEYVIGSYVTSTEKVKKNNKRKTIYLNIPLSGGGFIKQNMMELAEKEIPFFGVNIQAIIRRVHKTFLIINERTHYNESYLSIPHKSYKFPWLVTRGEINKGRILVFENKGWT